VPPVLITGASSGIGAHLVQTLVALGHPVFAGARQPADLEALAEIPGVTPVRLDVRDPEQIRQALQTVQQAGLGLYGLVNNAGVGQLGLLPTWPDEDLQAIFDINVFGPHRITNAFVRLLIEARGRIVNIGSQGGMITSKYYGPYTMTKHALEAYSECLHDELAPYGVSVSIVQPGGIVSEIGRNSWPGILAHFQNAEPPFKEEAEAFLASLTEPQEPVPDEPESATNRKPSSPAIVAEAVLHALFAEKPKLRYLVGTRWEGDRVIHALMRKLLDENDNPQHNYSRQQLIDILDQHIAERAE
jgi:NAD(P)-dependent dehydrogenase (short-subunit alcohol dehydrogenase family)